MTWCYLKNGKPREIKYWKTSGPSELIALLDFRCYMEDTLRVKREDYRIYRIEAA